MIKINAIGLECPKPVVLAKKALAEAGGTEEIMITVDNIIATENLEKLARAQNCEVITNKTSDTEYEVTITKNESSADGVNFSASATIVVLSSDKMGEGDDTLGASLMKAFVYALTESEALPSKILLYNGGVKLAIKSSPCIDDLKALEEKGVQIMSCGACLNFYELSEQLGTGEVTNMYAILEAMNSADKIIKP